MHSLTARVGHPLRSDLTASKSKNTPSRPSRNRILSTIVHQNNVISTEATDSLIVRRQ
jgi:hypothetical protein